MARPQTLSDDEIIEGAMRVIRRAGYDRFTLSEVARETGLSRPAILKRFKSAQALKVIVSKHAVDAFVARLDALPVERSGDGLLALVDFMGSMTRTHTGVARFFARHRGNLTNPALAAIERRRGKAWIDAIEARMPKTQLKRHDAARGFAALLSGAVMQWQNMPGANGAAYLRERAEDWLVLARIHYNKRPRARSPK